MLRIPIREQLAALLLLASLLGLAVLSIATWTSNYNFVLSIRSSRLSLVASLKASQLASNLALMENSCQFIVSRVRLQEALSRYNRVGNNTQQNWALVLADMNAALSGPAAGGAVGQSLLLQSRVWPVNASGPAGTQSVVNTTNVGINGTIRLPYNYDNGSSVYLGDPGLGYPAAYYPNFTYSTLQNSNGESVATAEYGGATLSPIRNNALLLGPFPINSTFAVVSISIPIVNNTSATDVLGWLTVLLDARLIYSVINSNQGLGNTGQMLLVSPSNVTNLYPPGVGYDTNPDPNIYNNVPAHFALPLSANYTFHGFDETSQLRDTPFPLGEFPAAVAALTVDQESENNSGSLLETTNEHGMGISAGFSQIAVPFVDWVVVIEMARQEVFQPTVQLRNLLLACVFGTIGVMIIIAWPLAHFASKPIRELKAATLKSVQPDQYDDTGSTIGDLDFDEEVTPSPQPRDGVDGALAKKEGFFTSVLRRRKRSRSGNTDDAQRRRFRIPGKVRDRKHIVTDELSELTYTFNEMSDELVLQYSKLEERVRTRTAELELSKKAAEAANESKTLFIANISHELKTPLNGILGMCAVCMQEDDPIRLKRSLGIIYKSGDLLLHLLTDLLTFSKNQVGQQLSLDEKEFRLRDISTQILAIFEKQAKDSRIDLQIQFMKGDEVEQSRAAGDVLGERVKDMVLFGDTHRILQVVINLVSNSLKFTPAEGKVTLTIKCSGETLDHPQSRKPSLASKTSKTSKKASSRNRYSDLSQQGGRNLASQDGSTHAGGSFARLMDVDRVTPPPGKTLQFEFEVNDTGPGIPEHMHDAIFEPFVQGDLGLSKKYGGTGLGLSICSQLAGLMHGGISLKSEVGKGSTFTLRIPLRHVFTRPDSTASSSAMQDGVDGSWVAGADVYGSPKRRSTHHDSNSAKSFPDANAAPVNPPPKDAYEGAQPRLVGLSQPYFASSQPRESPGSQPAAMDSITAAARTSGKIRVLVAEDNQVNQEVVLRMLKLEDIYDVTVAKDGQEALDMVKESMMPANASCPDKGPFNLIFMDVQMPNLDGLQSTKLIRETGFDAPIVALTAFAEESNVKDCLDSGMNYFLSKPIRRPALKKVLKEYCTPIQEVDEDQLSPGATTTKAGAAVENGVVPSSNGKARAHDPLAVNSSSGPGAEVVVHERRGSGPIVVVSTSRPGSMDSSRKSVEAASSANAANATAGAVSVPPSSSTMPADGHA